MIDLTRPLRWERLRPNSEESALLEDLQGNILKSHGRDHTAHLFLRFTNAHSGRTCVSSLAQVVTSAAAQLKAVLKYREDGIPGETFASLCLSATGYRALGINEAHIPDEPAFRAGMQRRGRLLADPPVAGWDSHFRSEVHAMLLIADSSADKVASAAKRLRKSIAEQGGVILVGEEIGKALKNEFDQDIEHFGYVDGISVPILLEEDLPKESNLSWNPAAPLMQALVRDPGSPSKTSYGSYLVFRKLEQNVRAFKQAEELLAHSLGLEGEDEERAGAMIIGRFEHGTPLVLSDKDDMPLDRTALNNFTYEADPHGRRCPFHAHIRKVNPRGESGRPLDERKHHVVRRGIPYGERLDGPNDEPPSGGVGLLFMAYQRDISEQFEYIQRHWANDAHYVKENTGIDPLIGQQHYAWPVGYGAADRMVGSPFSLGSFVTLKGGEYFFAPCISVLKAMAQPLAGVACSPRTTASANP